jgi:repressor LexA
MVEDGIRDGDLLVVQRREDVEVGQTVVALVDGRATVKRYYRQGDKVELRPANERFTAILAEPSAVHVEGVVVGLVRTFA